jgi:hypothetical protein
VRLYYTYIKAPAFYSLSSSVACGSGWEPDTTGGATRTEPTGVMRVFAVVTFVCTGAFFAADGIAWTLQVISGVGG